MPAPLDIPGAGQRVLAFTAHPDDEIFFAGLLHACARRGARVEVVCATAGEAGRRRDPTYSPELGLGALRLVELERSCAALGVASARCLGWPDGGVPGPEEGGSLQALGACLQGDLPALTLSFGPDGAYGHKDHVRLGRLAEAAWRLSGAPGVFAQAAFPRGLFIPLRRALSRVKGGPIDAGIRPEQLGCDRGDVDLCLPLTLPEPSGPPLAGVKRQALAAHRSQLAGGEPLSFLGEDLTRALLDEEWYRVVRPAPHDA